ncbi:MAG: transcriptional repressor [Culturomica sp.]|jgi:Fur family ferric uptake transcriptional regulator|nr:transcriptional repressor [Culturomica sp.]
MEASVKKFAEEKLTKYLEINNLRKTAERYAILEEIYSNSGHFTIESMYENIMKNNYRVSTGTLYNNMRLFVKLGLVVKHVFKGNKSQYENAHNTVKHDHLVCTECGRMEEFPYTEVQETLNDISSKRGFTMENHILYLHGICRECKIKAEKKNSDKTKKTN